MPRASPARRVEVLEERVDAPSALPGRMTALETELREFRVEVRGAFAAVPRR